MALSSTEKMTVHVARRVAAAFGLEGQVSIVRSGSGTASQAVVAQVGSATFYLKRRNPRYCAPEWMQYDAQVAERVAAAGLPVAVPLRAADGRPWVELRGQVYQMSRMLAGRRVDEPSLPQLKAIGATLATWHRATRDWRPSVRKPVGRLHDPTQASAWLCSMAAQAPGSHRSVLQSAASWAEAAGRAVPDRLYKALPAVVVHGDVHPANLHFEGNRLVGIFDYDWVCQAPRLTDLVDAIIYTAARRPQPIRDGDIRSITQPFRLEPRRVEALFEGYGMSLQQEEIKALPWLAVARWLFCRADAARRKIPPDERIEYVVRGLLAPIREIDKACRQIWGAGLH